MLRQNLILKAFGWFKVPMIGFAGPKVMVLNEEETIIRIPLNWRTLRRDLGSMYLGSLVVGADIASGLLAFMLGKQSPHEFNIIFKSLEADFKKRPQSDVLFRCAEGKRISALMEKAAESRLRESCSVEVTATAPKTSGQEIVAVFKLVLSVKVTQRRA
jgi:Domain of unknown function (DUF4442)